LSIRKERRLTDWKERLRRKTSSPFKKLRNRTYLKTRKPIALAATDNWGEREVQRRFQA